VVVMEEEDTFLPSLSPQFNFCYNWTIQTTHFYVGTCTLSYNLDKYSADRNIYQLNKYHHMIWTFNIGYIFSKLYIVLEKKTVKYCTGLTEICTIGNVLICCKHLLCTYHISVSHILHTMTMPTLHSLPQNKNINVSVQTFKINPLLLLAVVLFHVKTVYQY
jgi:hypothetical protein